MPTYQYSCTECGHFFEQFQSFSDAALTECPQCEGRLRKVFNAVGVVFKGSGFYRTDSRAGAETAKSSESSGSSEPGAAASTKTDTKTDTRTETKSGTGAAAGSSSASGAGKSASSSAGSAA